MSDVLGPFALFGLLFLIAGVLDTRQNKQWFYAKLWADLTEVRTGQSHPFVRWARAIEHLGLITDGIFGRKLFSARSFLRSGMLSLVFMLLLYGLASAELIAALGEGSYGRFADPELWRWFALTVAISFALTWLPDWLSLSQTRWFLRLVHSEHSARRVFGVVIGDAVLSLFLCASLGFISSLIAMFVVMTTWYGGPAELPRLSDLPDYFFMCSTGFTFRGIGGAHVYVVIPPIAPAFWSGMVASVWMWLGAVQHFVARLLSAVGGRLFKNADPDGPLAPRSWPVTSFVLSLLVLYSPVGLGWAALNVLAP